MKIRILILLSFFLFTHCSNEEQTASKIELKDGSIDRHENFSSEFIIPRNVDVWLPNGYTSKEKYAVLYMHDGQMLFDANSTWNKQEWGVDEVVTDLLDRSLIKDIIVVAIWSTELRHSEYFPQKPFENLGAALKDSLIHQYKRDPQNSLFKSDIRSDNYLKFITSELKPFIDEKYSTLEDKNNTMILGSSMGGLISIYALCEYPEIFGGAGCLSTHWLGSFDTLNNPIPYEFANYIDLKVSSLNEHKIYFDYGTETLDAYYEPYQLLIDSIMLSHGFDDSNWKTLKFQGENHSENAWKKRLHIPLTFLLKKK